MIRNRYFHMLLLLAGGNGYIRGTYAFTPTSNVCQRSSCTIGSREYPRKHGLLQAEKNEEYKAEAAALLPSNAVTSEPILEKNTSNSSMTSAETDIFSVASSTASVATMISRENRRVLIEELGYRRKDVESLKLDLVPAIVENRVKRPDGDLPDAWYRSQEDLEQESRMMERLEQESRFPLKFPLIGVSLVLFGKGFGDALITIIKVNIAFPGASLTEEFMGIPVLLIDALCVTLGSSLGWWTWKNMGETQD
mmetsp:Transcript_3047/g.4102  ORF Transcript_3047/g.4102 Transcript_3047/m.4102 type:complete len:252 (-) Transcript_3047:257-1012(-)|eukprot:CAMPEP_0198141754 /NCGR_PEP_ID=MMETSP1443-20131203/4701_1 /TAXON_ID=186043 /ORGANISM="Entomoneis sp., Strain CCMP2396" /LENGTH=251 /DNA_ID=CAMNT_0043804583 /DNA_START=66 /DNA_END=821 /DNA_ORIENTATION=+